MRLCGHRGRRGGTGLRDGVGDKGQGTFLTLPWSCTAQPCGAGGAVPCSACERFGIGSAGNVNAGKWGREIRGSSATRHTISLCACSLPVRSLRVLTLHNFSICLQQPGSSKAPFYFQLSCCCYKCSPPCFLNAPSSPKPQCSSLLQHSLMLSRRCTAG